MNNYGVSVSIKQCRNFGISPSACIKWLISDCGFKRFRLMSYWDEIESSPGVYDFSDLDQQIALIAKHKGTVTLCLGARQPRWPENHWPDWAWQHTKAERTTALLKYLEVVVKRYRSKAHIVSYQLENEALLKSFGDRPEVDRARLRQEFNLVQKLDPSRPIIMTTSTSWGIPLRRPIGDIVGFSYYQVIYSSVKEAYTTAFHQVWLQKLKRTLVKLLLRRSSIIHELQLEPWGPKNIWEMSKDEQMKSMSPKQIRHNILLAQRTGIKPIDLWGGEWWYWSARVHKDGSVIKTVLDSIHNE